MTSRPSSDTIQGRVARDPVPATAPLRRPLLRGLLLGAAGLCAACAPPATPTPAGQSPSMPPPIIATPQETAPGGAGGEGGSARVGGVGASVTPTPAHPPTPDPSAMGMRSGDPASSPVPPPTPTSLLGQGGLPPSGVEAQLETAPFAFFLHSACGLGVDATRPSLIAPELVELGERAQICAAGFDPGALIELSLRGPDGIADTHALIADEAGLAEWSWPALPGQPLGRYTVEARPFDARRMSLRRRGRGDAAIGAAFELTPASAPRILVAPEAGAAGTRFEVGMAGLAPGEPVTLHIYRRTADSDCSEGRVCWRFVATLWEGVSDESGAVRAALETAAGDPAGSYRIVPGADPMAFVRTLGNELQLSGD